MMIALMSSIIFEIAFLNDYKILIPINKYAFQ